MEDGGDKKLLIITSREVAEQTVQNLQEHNYARYSHWLALRSLMQTGPAEEIQWNYRL